MALIILVFLVVLRTTIIINARTVGIPTQKENEEDLKMANDGFFKCETPGCGYTVKVRVTDWQAEQGVLTSKRCPHCGGKLRKT